MELNIVWKLSAVGSSGPSSPTRSLGDFMSSTDMGSDLFEDIGTHTNAWNGWDYRCVFLHNKGNNHYSTCLVRVDNPTISLGVDLAGVVPEDYKRPQATKISTPREQPFGVDFCKGTLVLNNILPRHCVGVWFRRKISPLQGNELVFFRLITEGIK